MNYLVVAATSFEIAPFLEQYRENSLPLNKVTTVDVLITGIGLTAATYALSRQLSLKRPDLVIQAGIAGSFDKKLAPGTVVAVKQDTIADQGVVEKNDFRTVFDLGLVRKNQPPFSKGWLVNKHALLRRSKLKRVNAVSINEITTSPKRIALYLERYKPAVESMEGAALHYVCLQENVPFVQLRAISNYVGVRDKKKWDFKESVKNLNRELIRLLTN